MFDFSSKYLKPPKKISTSDYRSYMISSFLYYMCIVIHASLLLLFYFIKVYPMVIFNIFSITIFVFNVFLNRNGKLALAYNIAISEIVVHACLATIYVGWNSNFPVYTVSLIVVNMYCSSAKPKSRLIFSFLSIIANSLTYILVIRNSPIYQIDQITLSIVGIINLFIISLAILVVCYIYLIITENLKVEFNLSEKILREKESIIISLKNNIKKLEKSAKDISSNIKNSTAKIATISNSIESINNSSVNSAALSEEILLSTREASKQSFDISHSSFEIKNEGEKVLLTVNEGEQLIDTTRKSILMVEKNSKSILEQIKDIKETSQLIEKIIVLVKNVTKEIKLLSINASIESQKAGSSTNGFSIIAQEIRKLSDKTKKSSDEINSLIESIREKIDKLLHFSESNISLVSESVENSLTTSEKFKSVLDSIERMVENIKEIASSTEKQSTITEEIVNSINQSAQLSIEISSSIDEINSNTKSQLSFLKTIETVSQELDKIADNLKTNVDAIN